MPQRPNLDFSLTAREILLFHAAYFGIASKQRQERADALLERFKLSDRGDQMVRGFSGGMMQRLSIARAMMHDPEVSFLDEPSVGLDPQTRILLWEIIRECRAGKICLLHHPEGSSRDRVGKRSATVCARRRDVARLKRVPVVDICSRCLLHLCVMLESAQHAGSSSVLLPGIIARSGMAFTAIWLLPCH